MDFTTGPTFNTNTDPAHPTLENELAHATEEMYKKNVELNEINKTLSLLRKIDVIILSTVNDPKLIAQQVANVIVEEAGFNLVSICIVNDKVLSPLATSFTQTSATLGTFEHHPLINDLPLSVQDNLVIQSVLNRETKVTNNLYDIVGPYHAPDEIVKMQEFMKISHFLSFPIIVRDEVIGAMVIGLNQTIESLSQSQKDLIDRLSGVIGIAIDNALLYKKIEDANRRLEQLDKIKDEFVSLASHELRTPMTVIKSYVWLMLQGKVGALNDKQKVYLERTYSSVDRLINLVNDMLNISRIESGRLQITPTALDMNTVIADVITEMSSRAQEQEVHLEMQTIKNLPKVFADSERVKQVLINLIGNSLKFTPKQGYIKVGEYVKDGFVITQVSDTGRGISEEDLPKLFQKFNMVGENYMTKLNVQGTGLGLYLSKSLVELHGGKIWVESDGEGKGATFSFSLPTVNSNTSMNLPKDQAETTKQTASIDFTKKDMS